MNNETTILFYRVSEVHGEFSNFSPHPIELEGRTWPTSEHHFQAQKFVGADHAEAIRQAKSPMVAARMGRSRQRPLRTDWEAVKDDVMRAALRSKFTQHPALRSLCLLLFQPSVGTGGNRGNGGPQDLRRDGVLWADSRTRNVGQ
jgi:ribA/ribD-fused uncharacterized protein